MVSRVLCARAGSLVGSHSTRLDAVSRDVSRAAIARPPRQGRLAAYRKATPYGGSPAGPDHTGGISASCSGKSSWPLEPADRCPYNPHQSGLHLARATKSNAETVAPPVPLGPHRPPPACPRLPNPPPPRRPETAEIRSSASTPMPRRGSGVEARRPPNSAWEWGVVAGPKVSAPRTLCGHLADTSGRPRSCHRRSSGDQIAGNPQTR